MAPELWDVNHENYKNYQGDSADVWSVGVILFMLGNYKYPFNPDTWTRENGFSNNANF